MDPYLVTMLLACTALQLPLPTQVSFAHPVRPCATTLLLG